MPAPGAPTDPLKFTAYGYVHPTDGSTRAGYVITARLFGPAGWTGGFVLDDGSGLFNAIPKLLTATSAATTGLWSMEPYGLDHILPTGSSYRFIQKESNLGKTLQPSSGTSVNVTAAMASDLPIGGGLDAPAIIVLTTGSYANPSWITSLAWGKITGTPTTLAGYGITDGGTGAAGSLTGPTLAANVIHSSLTTAAGGTFGSAAFTASSAYDAAGAAAAAQAASQPVDTDLTAIAALSTVAFGRSLLTQADAAAARTAIGAGTGNGSVTSVNLTAPAAGITVSGGPVTTSGAITLALADDLAALEALSGTSTLYYRSGASAWSAATFGNGVTFSGGVLGLGAITPTSVSSAAYALTGNGKTWNILNGYANGGDFQQNEFLIKANLPGDTVGAVQNTANGGYTGWGFRDENGNLKLTIGYANTGAGYFGGRCFIDQTIATGTPPDFIWTLGTAADHTQVFGIRGSGTIDYFLREYGYYRPAGTDQTTIAFFTGNVVASTANFILRHRNDGKLGLTTPGGAGLTVDTDGSVAVTGTFNGNTFTAGTGTLNLATYTLTAAGTASVSGTNTGDQTITLTGNVTGSGSGSFATTIAAGAVTLAMQANMATSSLVYRKTAGNGAPEINTLATLKTDLGLTGTNSGDQTITLTGDATGSGTGSFAVTLANTAVTAGSYGSATASPTYAVDAKGRLTLAANVTITPAVGSITGMGTNASAALVAGASVGGLSTYDSGKIARFNTLGNLTATGLISIIGDTVDPSGFALHDANNFASLTLWPAAGLSGDKLLRLPGVNGTVISDADTGTVTNAMLAGSIDGGKISGGTLGATAGTNLTGTAAGLTAGNVTTNANLTGDVTSVGNATTIGSSKVTSAMIVDGAIINADINASAAIAYSKLALTGAILNADLAGSIAYSKLSLTGAILNADLAGSITGAKIIAGTAASGSWDVASGGTGRATLTANNVLLGNGTSAVQMIAPGASGNVLTSDGTTFASTAPAAAPAGANPSGTVGLSAVNGSASTFMRSDGAPALSQAIAPTWTGVHAFSPAARTSGSASYLTITTPADTGLATATESIGLNLATGTRTFVDGTVALQRERYFAGPTYNKTTTSATFTDSFNLYLDKPIAGTGVTFTRGHTLGIVDSTVAASTITGAVVIATTLGTAGTSIGMGGGVIRAGTSIYCPDFELGTTGGFLAIDGSNNVILCGNGGVGRLTMLGTTANFNSAITTLTFNGTTESTTTGTGCVVMIGGLGVAKNLNVGGTSTLTGVVTFGDSGTGTASAGAVTLNKQTGVITTESLTTAAGATYTLTLTNSRITTASNVQVTVGLGSNTTADVKLATVTEASGSVSIVIYNDMTITALNGTLKIKFVVF